MASNTATGSSISAPDALKEPDVETAPPDARARAGARSRAQARAARSLPSILRRDADLRRALAIADLLACAAALAFATQVLVQDGWRWPAPLMLLAVVPMAKLVGLYDRDEQLLRKSTLDEAVGVLRLATWYTLSFWLLAPLLVLHPVGREQVLGAWGLLILMVFATRFLARWLVLRGCPEERCLIVGEQETCERLAGKLDGSRGISATPALGLPFASAREEQEEMRRLAEGRLDELVRRHDIHRLVLAPHDSDAAHILDLLQAANALNLHISIVPRMLEVVGTSVEFDDLNGLTVLGVKRFGLSRSSRALKRAFDLAGSLLGLLLLGPIFGMIAIVIRLDSPGPALFRQRRVGEDGRTFSLIKFRTMIDGADAMRPELEHRNEADGLFKIAEDPRITRAGRTLRRLYIDELPQLINVLRGEMSLVGPRPLVAYEDERVEGRYRDRLTLTPGMTGRWQILGSARVPLSEMVKLDYLYVANWSLWNDVKILLRTVPYVLGRRGM